ncbi:MAG: Fe-S cluster assembly protein SufD [Burkholderiaceae bacterium]|nr:Fe-S cluster assembly protein SufD [Burkholderiaceae bacterium]
MSAAQPWVDAFRERAPALAGAALPWLAETRRRALDRFAAEGWPSARTDAWRHTSLLALEQENFAVSAPAAQQPSAARLRAVVDALREGDGGHWAVFVDGSHVASLSAPGRLPGGAEVASLARILDESPERVEAHFGAAEDGYSPAALNTAFAADGAFVHLRRGVVVEEPIHLVFVGATARAAIHVRNLVVAEAGAQATIVEHHVKVHDEPLLSNVVTRVDCADDARITHLKLQQESERAVHLARIQARQSRGSMFASHSLSFGARLARNDIVTRFDGTGCEALLNGLYHVDGKRHVDHHTVIDHAQPYGTSREFYRGILDEAGRGVFAGRIVVAPGALRTDAIQRTDNLLLSRQAEADARPELEIYADDVKCAHGATVGRIDESALFYLRSRGIDEERSRNLLTWAFAAETLSRIGVASLQRRARAALLARLPGGAALDRALEELG